MVDLSQERTMGQTRALRNMRVTVASRFAPRAMTSLRSVAVAEAVLGVAIVSAASVILPGQWGFERLQPHPLWIVVLAIAIRYAVPAGYVAGVLAAASQVLLLWLQPGTRFQAIPEHDLIQPFLFVVVGMLVSYAVEGKRQRLADIERRMEETNETLRTTTGAYLEIRTAKLELEKQIVGQSTSITTLYRIAKRLETLHLDDLYPAILDLVEQFLECQACAIYLVEGNQLRLRAAVPESVVGRRRTLGLDDGLIGKAIRERRVITIRDQLLQDGPALLNDEPALIAGPLTSANGDVCGVIVIERLPFLKFTPATISLFSIILDWTSTALANASQHEEARDRLIEDDVTGAYRATHMVQLLREHLQRGLRYQVPVTVVVAQISGLTAIEPEACAEMSRIAVTTMRTRLRSVDIIGHHSEPDQFILILPMTDRASAGIACARILIDLNAAPLAADVSKYPLDVRFAIIACTETMTVPEAVLNEASKLLASRPSVSALEGEESSHTAMLLMHSPLTDDLLSMDGSCV